MGDVIDRHIGGRLRELRQQRHLAPAMAADRAGLSTKRLLDIEEGELRATATELHALALMLGVSIAQFFEGMPEDVPTDRRARELSSTGAKADVGHLVLAFERLSPALQRRLVGLFAAMIGEPG